MWRYVFCALCLVIAAFCMGCTSADKSKPVEKQKEAAMAIKISPMVKLNSGYEMPVLGLGTWTLKGETAQKSVETAIECGYRLIDTARYYGNEEDVGQGIRNEIEKGTVKREEIFVTSKIMLGDYRRADVAIDESLTAIGLDYIDLMLIHQPGPNDEKVYKALERGVKAGKIRSIGISNYYTPQDFERINSTAEITPAVVQNENHPYYQNTALKDYLKKYGTLVESWYPFGGRGNTEKVLSNKVIGEIARAHSRTAAQIDLRWQIQAGYIVIPGSSNPAHIRENNDIFDFELSSEEMEQMAGLNRNARFENW